MPLFTPKSRDWYYVLFHQGFVLTPVGKSNAAIDLPAGWLQGDQSNPDAPSLWRLLKGLDTLGTTRAKLRARGFVPISTKVWVWEESTQRWALPGVLWSEIHAVEPDPKTGAFVRPLATGPESVFVLKPSSMTLSTWGDG